MRSALAAGDGQALGEAVERSKAAIAKLKGCPSSASSSLKRVLLVAEARVEQYQERVSAKASKQAHEDRVARGLCPDWTITPAQLWQYVADCNVAKVQAGMRAKLPVAPKSKDGLRQTVIHIACRDACTVQDEDMTSVG